jgi:hypothetical protein
MSETRLYCIYCDHRYLPRAQSVIQSLRSFECVDEIWLYCLTPECRRGAEALAMDNVRLFDLADLEMAYPALLQVKAERTILEYYYTCTPFVMDHAMKSCPDADTVTYLDADLWFFGDPERVFDEIGDAPVAIVPHNFPPRLTALEKFGRYNVGWVTFRRSEEGIACLEWWRDRCLEWCFGKPEGDRCGDQGYLEKFIQVAPHTKVIRHKGCNTAPWNIENYVIANQDGHIFVDDDPLIFFHFHGVQRGLGVFYFSGHRRYGAPQTLFVRNHLYRPYIVSLNSNENALRRILPHFDSKRVRLRGNTIMGVDVKNLSRSLMAGVHQILDLAVGRPIFAWQSHIY